MSETPFDKNYNTLIPDRVDWDNNIPGRSGNLKFYTDGSKLNGKVGYGLYYKELDVNLAGRLPDTCSVYQAEILTIRDVAEWLRRNVVTNTGVHGVGGPKFKNSPRLPLISAGDGYAV